LRRSRSVKKVADAAFIDPFKVDPLLIGDFVLLIIDPFNAGLGISRISSS
jgi:hypothetical protein